MSEPLEDQVKRLADFITENFPGEPSQGQGAIDTAIRLLSKPHLLTFPKPTTEAEAARLKEAIRQSVENPGRAIYVDDLGDDEIRR